MHFIYIGEKYYWESGTLMSSIYEITEDGFKRSDWGKISIALMNKNEIYIRHANIKELNGFERILKDLKGG